MSTSVIYRIVTFCLLATAAFPVFPRDRTLLFGGKTGWQAFSYSDRIIHSSGAFGYESIEVTSSTNQNIDNTDLLLDFENGIITDKTGNYTVKQSDVLPYSGIIGKGGALTTGTGGIQLEGSRFSMFGSAGLVGSFSIEFWLKPAIVENGEVIIEWQSSRLLDNNPVYQHIRVYLYNNHMNWSFTNLFNGYTNNGGEFSLAGTRIVIPELWAHHRVSFDDETGLFEYRIDGKLEAIRYMTTTGKENGTVLQPVTGAAAELEICTAYTGAIDDFRITRNAGSLDINKPRYNPAGARIETMPVRCIAATSFSSISAITKTPPQTAVQFFVRAGGDLFNWNENYPEWVPVEPGKTAPKPVSGEYFQVAAVLYPDGAGKDTPSITEIALTVREELPPLPPSSVRAEARDGAVTVNWLPSVDILTAGYLVYYGERPGEYLGVATHSGASPVNAGNRNSITLSGLQNGKIYYIAIASYSKLDATLVGELSAEVFARPLKGKGVPNE